MILRDGTDTARWAESGRHLDAMALVLDRLALIDGKVTECWIVGSTFAEFLGRRVLYSHSTDDGLHYWSARYRNRKEAKRGAAEVLGVAVDEMVRS